MNPFERYPYSSRIKDRISELFGIVQEDGTTSVLQNDIDMLYRKRNIYETEVNRITMQISYLKNNFMDRQYEYEELVKLKVDTYGNRILPYGLPISTAYQKYRQLKGNDCVFNEHEFTNIYSNLMYLIEAENQIREIDRKINMYEDYQKRR